MVCSYNPWPDPLEGDDPPVGVSIRPLGADQLPPLPPPPAPTGPTLPERTGRRTRVFGAPGASATAQYRRRRAAEWADYLHTLPLRLPLVIAGGFAGYALASALLLPHPGWLLALGAVAAGWLLRFRVSVETAAWRRGAKGEQRTARRLGRLGRSWSVFHDLAIPSSRTNADHLAIGPSGVFMIDTKHYRGRLILTPEGSLWYGHHPLADILATVRWEATVLSQTLGTTVTPMLCIHGAQLPWGELMAEGIPVLAASRVTTTLCALPPLLDEVQVALLTERARRQLRPAA